MSVTINGNHSKGYLGGGANANGAQNIAVGMGWLAATGNTAADKTVIQLSSILLSNINQGIFFQSEAAATVEFTLANPALAMSQDPVVTPSVPWGNLITLVAGTVQKAPVLFTACRITFTAPGTVYLGVR